MIKSEYLNTISSIFEKRGFTKIETPIIENSDIYLRKLGPELAGQLYSFVDPDGNNVTLRPDLLKINQLLNQHVIHTKDPYLDTIQNLMKKLRQV